MYKVQNNTTNRKSEGGYHQSEVRKGVPPIGSQKGGSLGFSLGAKPIKTIAYSSVLTEKEQIEAYRGRRPEKKEQIEAYNLYPARVKSDTQP